MKKVIICDRGNVSKVSSFCEKNNFGVNIDILYYPDYLNLNVNTIENILEGYKNTEITSIHGPIDGLCFGSGDELVKSIAKKRFEYAYKLSCKFNSKNIILHNGYTHGTTLPKYWFKESIPFWKNFLQNKNCDSTFYLENLTEHSPDIIFDLINSVNKSNLKMCFDVGHANIFSKIDLIKWIEKANMQIGIVHLHNNNGIDDEHLELNTGKINMLEICNALEKYCPNAIWAIETRKYQKSIEWLKNNYLL